MSFVFPIICCCHTSTGYKDCIFLLIYPTIVGVVTTKYQKYWSLSDLCNPLCLYRLYYPLAGLHWSLFVNEYLTCWILKIKLLLVIYVFFHLKKFLDWEKLHKDDFATKIHGNNRAVNAVNIHNFLLPSFLLVNWTKFCPCAAVNQPVLIS